ncbi:hypothetical protein ACFRDV_26620 [Streptomyces fagopyri]|uniref:Uncharacterized protein n=1 Tax=Streptomyces fagopyri TaxID=2662397 RepID=A0A5Q0L4K2_9ACTN|nr:hypothetical protein [Streptomyces fagopyri]QFZ71902.1 hypothetical protein GFH48_00200 [Streptomyces fagopyri]
MTQRKEHGRPAFGPERFAPQGLLRRRAPASDADGWYSRRDLPRPAGGTPPPPTMSLPAGLLPLPTGFEPATEPEVP